ncbi:MAG: ankyrin repeat domain-containing protein [Candidatus Eremiobacteraeota bacterium]|nr:ankyrin repeat domain-containing protein [Candidatus Eremiobacteraeota bacterium]
MIAKIVKKAVLSLYILSMILCPVIILLILLITHDTISYYLRARVSGQFTQCQSNLKNIGTALEMYAHDNQGHYPPRLSHISPKYLESIPVCIAVKRDTYSNSYQVSSDAETFTVYCEGHHHSGAGIEPNCPQYNSTYGPTYSVSSIKRHPLRDFGYALDARKDLKAFRKLIDKNPSLIHDKNLAGGTVAIHNAVFKERWDVVELLIESGADIHSDKWSLPQASLKGKKEIVELLISKGADVNIGIGEAYPPLHLAVSSGHKEIVEILLRNGADINSRDKEYHTPLFHAMKGGHSELAEFIREKGGKE